MRLTDADAFIKEMEEKIFPELVKRYGEEEALKGLHFSYRDCICNINGQPTVDIATLQQICNKLATRLQDDCISRQAAVDAGLWLCGRDTKAELINFCDASIADSEGRAGGILDYIDALEDLPSIQPEILACGEGELSAQPEYEEITPEEAASEIASGSLMSASYWLSCIIQIEQMGYAICRKR